MVLVLVELLMVLIMVTSVANVMMVAGRAVSVEIAHVQAVGIGPPRLQLLPQLRALLPETCVPVTD